MKISKPAAKVPQPNAEAISVSEATRRLKTLIERSPLLKNLTIDGEVSNLTYHGSGHAYFTLKDETAQIQAVWFAGSMAKSRFRPQEGDQVKAFGEITVYEVRGQYQLIVNGLEPSGAGDYYLQWLILKDRLEKEGLFAPERKRQLPVFPRRIAVVTSPTGAVIQDIIQTIKRRFPHLTLLIVPTAVQGAQAAPEIVTALQKAQSLPNLDLIILARGGGSQEDLRCFNDETVVRAVAGCAVPIIAAIGHETDYTLTDLTADLRAPTPTAAAELATPDAAFLKEDLLNVKDYFIRLIRGQLYRSIQFNDDLSSRLTSSMRQNLLRQRNVIEQLDVRLRHSIRSKLQTNRLQLETMAAQLEALNMDSVLQRGFTLTLQDGQIARRLADVDIKKPIETVFADGRLVSMGKEKTEE